MRRPGLPRDPCLLKVPDGPTDRDGRLGIGSPARRCGRSLQAGIRCSRWFIIPSHWNGDCLPNEPMRLHRSEQAALAAVREVVVTSPATAKLVAADYGVPAERITVARPGSDPAPRSSGSRSEVPHLLSVGAVVPRKGFDVLVAALATIG